MAHQFEIEVLIRGKWYSYGGLYKSAGRALIDAKEYVAQSNATDYKILPVKKGSRENDRSVSELHLV